MATLRFISEQQVETWVDSRVADLNPGALVDLETQESCPTREAVRFIRVEWGEDEKGLTNRVLGLEDVKALGGEFAEESFILGQTVYAIARGWMLVCAAPAES